MREYIRKTIPFLAAFLAIALMYFLPVQGTLAHAEETDAGGTREEAKVIELGNTYSETTESSSDVDFFKFTTTKQGYFQVTLKHNEADKNDTEKGWYVKVLDETGEVITSGTDIKKNWTSVNIPYAKAGRVFYLEIGAEYTSFAPLNCVYDLTVNQTEAGDWELETNETKADATTIGMNKMYHGITISEDDKDIYKFTTTKQGYFQVTLKHNEADKNDTEKGWYVKVLDETGEVITSGTDIKKNWTSVNIPYAKAGRVFYLEIGAEYTSFAPLNCVYDLTVMQTAAPSWESEPNGTTKTAVSMKMGKKYNGITGTEADEDYYKLSVPASGKLKVRFSSHNSNSSDRVGRGWDVVIYDKKSNEVTKMQEVKTVDSVSFNVKKGVYYIKIVGSNSWAAPVGCRYTLLADYVKAPSAPKISTIKAEKKSAVVKWKKVSGVNGYYVYRSTSKKGGFKKVQTMKKASALSWKNKKLKSGRKYYYKVAAYKKVKGMTVVSSYSVVKSVKVK